jgi:uncharacterized DUF497 family protein
MEFDWWPPKAESNWQKHRLGFEEAVLVFADPNAITLPAIRDQDGEDRYETVGLIDGFLHVVVWTWRDPYYWVISARRTNVKEDRAYAEANPKDYP